jgi:hypothetical protein
MQMPYFVKKSSNELAYTDNYEEKIKHSLSDYMSQFPQVGVSTAD